MLSTVTGVTPFRQTASRLLVGLLLFGNCCLLSAKPVQRGLSDRESFSADVDGRGGTLSLQVAGNAASAGQGTLAITNDDGFVWWTSPLKSSGGNTWTAPLNRESVEALLVGTKVQATFPKAAGEDDIVITVPTEKARDVLKTAAPIMAGVMPFFKEPAAPDKPDLPSADAGERAVSEFASEAISWDRRMTAYRYDYAAAVSRARALWMDLVTAGRVPWVDVKKPAGNFADVEAKKADIEKAREAFRKQAATFVQNWNNAHSQGGNPVQLKFDEATTA